MTENSYHVSLLLKHLTFRVNICHYRQVSALERIKSRVLLLLLETLQKEMKSGVFLLEYAIL